jgi:hypothetical protein
LFFRAAQAGSLAAVSFLVQLEIFTMKTEQLNHILAALIRMEDKTKETIKPDEYWAMSALAQECHAPMFITEYFARKAITQGEQP